MKCPEEVYIYTVTVKILTIWTPENLLLLSLNLNKVTLP